MSATFSRTIRSLEAGRCRRPLLRLLAAALVFAWAAWFMLGRMWVYEVTDKAWIEVTATAHAIQAPVAGQVVELRLTMGQEVHEGDVLLRLDAEPECLMIQERQAHRVGLAARFQALQKEVEAERGALSGYREARQAALEETRRQIPESEARANYAQTHAELEANLLRKNATASDEYKKVRAEAQASRALVQSLSAVPIRVEKDRLAQEEERKVRLARLQREAVEYEGDIHADEMAIHKLDFVLRTGPAILAIAQP
jgi:multidrug resistance efflux pump